MSDHMMKDPVSRRRGSAIDETASAWSGYHIELDIFDGPLDLLLFLIRRDELNIFDIPIAEITNQYLSFLDDVEDLDLDRAGDYLLMAATLMAIKARTLLPGREVDEESNEEMDPRMELAFRLIEYQTFKEVSKKLSEAATERMKLYPRGEWLTFENEPEENGGEVDHDLSINEMLKVFTNLIYTLKPVERHTVPLASFSITEKIDWIRKRLDRERRFEFQSLFGGMINREELVVTFIALLELIHVGEVKVRQDRNFEKLVVIRI